MIPAFGDYIVFIDETGSPTLSPIDPTYPLFGLIFCVVEKNHYADVIQPAIKKLKFEFFGHDMVVLHANDIRKPTKEYNFLLNPNHRLNFMNRLSSIFSQSDFKIISCFINKKHLVSKYSNPYDPYNIALRLCLERLSSYLKQNNQAGKLTHLIAEGRGRLEDLNLELEFRRILDPNYNWGMAERFDLSSTPFEIRFVEKKINSSGLQLADMVGQPIGRKILKPQVENQAYNMIEPKLWGGICRFP